MNDSLLRMSKRDIDRHDVLKRLIRKEIRRSYAAKLLRLTPRHVGRLKQAFLTSGIAALIHKQRGKPSHNRLPSKERLKITRLLKDRYPDFGPSFAAEKLREIHKIDHDPKTIRAIQIKEGLWKPRRSRSKSEHRAWRQRRSAYGEMIQFDGSYHHWFEDRNGTGEVCLLVAIDDATGKIVKALFAPHEGLFPVMGFWKSFFETHGKPRSIYLDKFSTYKMNHSTAKENPDTKTQFHRAMESLHVELIFANSPQAKGRVERVNATLQDRLVKELRLAQVSSIEEGNKFLEETFIPSFNARFASVPTSASNLHTELTLREREALPHVLSRQEERSVNNDFTFSFRNQRYQLNKSQPVTICKKEVVTVEEWLDGSLHVRLRGKDLETSVLPERPKRAHVPFVLAKTPALPQKPPKDHPWRKYVLRKVPLKTPS